MVRLAINVLMSALGNLIGLLIAAAVIEDFSIRPLGLVTSVLFFTIAQTILAPFVLKLAIKYTPVLRGGIALVTVFIVLILTVIFTKGITVGSVSTWIVAPLVIWLATVIAGIVLPMFLFKKSLSNKKSDIPNSSNNR